MDGTIDINALKQAGGTDASEPGGPTSGAISELLNSGRFAEYHLEKAKAAVATGELATALYQAEASLCHDRLPEAVALRAELKSRIKRR